MNLSQGPHFIDGTLTFTVTTHDAATGALTDADAVPAYRVYEDETGTAILTGNMAKLDDSNTTGFYSEQITLSAANGFEVGKSYSIYVTAAVGSVTGGATGSFKVNGPLPADVLQVNAGAAGAVPAFGIIDRGTAQSATGTTLVLRAGAAFGDDELIGATLVITGGSAGVGQRAVVRANVGSTDTVTVDTWTTTPSGTITYEIYASAAAEGVAQTGDAYARLGAPAEASIAADIAVVVARVLGLSVTTGAVATDGGNSATSFKTTLAEDEDDHWKDAWLTLTTGDLAGQTKRVSAYDGTSKVITVVGGFTATPADAVTFGLVNR